MTVSDEQYPLYAESDLRAFIGEGDPDVQHHYIESWKRFSRRPLGIVGFNWAATCFGLNWCFFRKMYLVGAVLVLTEFAAGVMLVIAVLLVSGDQVFERYEVLLTYAGLIPVRFTFGLLADSVYFRRACRAIDRVSGGREDGQTLNEIERRGGTSGIGLAVGLGISAASVFAFNLWPTLTATSG